MEKTVGADGKARKQQTRKPKQNPSLDETRVDNDRAWEIAQPIRPPDPDPQPLFDPTDATAEREAAEVSAEKRKAQYAAAEREQTPAELLANSGDYRGGDQIAVFVLADQIHKLFPTMSESARAGVVRFATEIAAQYADVEAAA